MRLVKTLPILLGLGAALGSVSAWALPNDQQQPIRIQADDAQLDDKNGVATYTGDVIITQGSMKVTGNKVTITPMDQSASATPGWGEIVKNLETVPTAPCHERPTHHTP